MVFEVGLFVCLCDLDTEKKRRDKEMSRGGNGEMRNVNSAVETINAAATAIASAEYRIPPPAVQVICSLSLFSIP